MTIRQNDAVFYKILKIYLELKVKINLTIIFEVVHEQSQLEI